MWFESFANSERYKTGFLGFINAHRLRALLIQKDTKLLLPPVAYRMGLRALLIQKDTKPDNYECSNETCLRALLIQKDTKQSSALSFRTYV